jgi:hypothetical protein
MRTAVPAWAPPALPAAPRSPRVRSSAGPAGTGASDSRFSSPETYTPKHLAEKILTSNAALESERKQVTVLFADMKGSMELLADRVAVLMCWSPRVFDDIFVR